MSRRHDLDWVRVCAFGLLVLYHVGMYYVTWDWHVKSPAAGTTIEPLMFLTAPWRLSLLFLVSGAATAFLLQRCSDGFLRARSWRLLVPLLFGMLVIVPPQSYYEVVTRLPGGYHDGYLAFWGRYLAAEDGFCRDGECLVLPTWNHLWFVAYLWVYTLVLWLLMRLAPRAMAATGARLARQLEGVGLLAWPVLFLAVARLALVGVFETTHALIDDWYNHVQYFAVFFLGFAIAGAATVWERIEALRWPALAMALGSWAFLAWYFGHHADVQPPQALRMLQRALWGLNQWTAIIAALGFARRLAPSGDSPLLRYLGGAVFTVYILHQTVIVVLARALLPLALAPWVEGPLLVVATFALSLAGFEVARRIPVLRPLLGIGRRRPRPPAPAFA